MLFFYVLLVSKYRTLRHDRCVCACKANSSEDGLLMLVAQASSTRRREVAESSKWQAVSKRTVVGILAQLSINWNPPHCALMPLNHPLQTWGPCQAGTTAGTAPVGMVMAIVGERGLQPSLAWKELLHIEQRAHIILFDIVWHCEQVWWEWMWSKGPFFCAFKGLFKFSYLNTVPVECPLVCIMSIR